MRHAAAVAILAALSCLSAGLAVGRRARGHLLERAGRSTPDVRPTIPFRWWRGRRLRVYVLRPLVMLAGLGVGSVVAGVPGAIAGLAMALVGPAMVARRRTARREEQIEAQLAEAVSGIAAGLRAGLSLSQAVRFAADEGQVPLAEVLREVIDRTSLGVPLGESLERWAHSDPGPDVRLVVGVLRLHHRTGGDLPAVLDQLARTLRERRAAGRELRSLTAQARLSGAILGLLPVGFFLFLSATSRQDIAAAYRSPTGATAITVGLALQAGAFLWIRRLLRVPG